MVTTTRNSHRISWSNYGIKICKTQQETEKPKRYVLYISLYIQSYCIIQCFINIYCLVCSYSVRVNILISFGINY